MFIEITVKDVGEITIPVSRIYNLQPRENGCVICLFPLQTEGTEDYLRSLIKQVELENSYEDIKFKLKAR